MGLYESLIMNFGLCNAPATFQTFMDEQFKDLVGTSHIVVYLDDVLIFADNEAELEELTHKVLQWFLDLDLFLHPEKCTFNRTSVEYLRLIISEGELRMDLVKLEAVHKWPRPKTIKDIQKFLGFCNFYCRFIKNYSELARPLFDLTKKGKPFIWTERQDTAFMRLQDTLTSSPVLLLPNYGRPFTLYTDASDYATSTILEQDDALG